VIYPPDSWSILILEQALAGATHFGEFQQTLGVAPTTLTRRLNALVAAGLMERRPYLDHPRREEYVLTDCGLAFRAVVEALIAWNHFYRGSRT